MSSIHALPPIDQAEQRPKPSNTRRRRAAKRAWEVLPHYATHTNAPTLSDAKQAAAGVFAKLLVAWVETHDQEVQHGA